MDDRNVMGFAAVINFSISIYRMLAKAQRMLYMARLMRYAVMICFPLCNV
jgi:hypothetical protein